MRMEGRALPTTTVYERGSERTIWIVAQHMGRGPSFAERVASPDVSPYPDCKTQSLCVQTKVSGRSNVCRVPKQKQRR